MQSPKNQAMSNRQRLKARLKKNQIIHKNEKQCHVQIVSVLILRVMLQNQSTQKYIEFNKSLTRV